MELTGGALIQERIAALDPTVFSAIDSLTTDWDRQALLALHHATAARLGSFTYLEIGSFRGGSLQAVMQDPRCAHVISIDPHPPVVADKRAGRWTYGEHSTADLRGSLSRLPAADMSKLTTLESGTDALDPRRLPSRPDWCFVDGEHTDEATLRDARFCRAAMGDAGVIAFHDSHLIAGAIRTFLREAWPDVSHAVQIAQVFALELGGRGILRAEVVDRAVASRWHTLTWRLVSHRRLPAGPLLAAWSAMPVIDAAILRARARLGVDVAQVPRQAGPRRAPR